MARYGRLLTDAQWEKIRPLLPKRPPRPRGGRPPAPDRKVLEGILWILRSGDGYKRQMEVYQWLLRERGFNVSNTGYFVYANASKEEESFGGRLLFEVTLVPYIGSSKWVEGALRAIKECLDGEKLPASAAECDYCSYRHAAETVLARYPLTPLKKSTRRKAEKKITKKISQSLFSICRKNSARKYMRLWQRFLKEKL